MSEQTNERNAAGTARPRRRTLAHPQPKPNDRSQCNLKQDDVQKVRCWCVTKRGTIHGDLNHNKEVNQTPRGRSGDHQGHDSPMETPPSAR